MSLEEKSRMCSGNACHHSVQNVASVKLTLFLSWFVCVCVCVKFGVLYQEKNNRLRFCESGVVRRRYVRGGRNRWVQKIL